jgi:mandelate racemase
MNGVATIARVRVRGVNRASARPVQTAAGVLRTTPLVLIDLITSDDVVGRAYLRCYTPTLLAPLVRLVRALADVVLGMPCAPRAVEAALHGELKLIGSRGLTGMAMAGLDMAVWDALARAAGLPLVTLLGGIPRPVRAYASLRSMAPMDAATEAEQAVSAGFTAVKVKVGGADLAADLATIRNVRAAIGDRTGLMIDYNQSLSVPDAIRRAHFLDDEGLLWIEEPTLAEDSAGHARIAAAARTPIQLGENWLGPHEAAAAIAAGATDYLMFDAMKIGGVSGWLRAAAHAHTAGFEVSSHTFCEVSVHLLAASPTGQWLEYLDHMGDLLTEPLVVRDGHAVPPAGPGTGLEWNEDVVRRSLVEE